ncbi:hypothetical protein SDC9_122588 [bioreactor metagenome]|uniref:Uncharacterized protein n=1 Tax=bioreactor metagenome TaxID=1076179 RepID=A0A645CF99_9ZZZZ
MLTAEYYVFELDGFIRNANARQRGKQFLLQRSQTSGVVLFFDQYLLLIGSKQLTRARDEVFNDILRRTVVYLLTFFK